MAKICLVLKEPLALAELKTLQEQLEKNSGTTIPFTVKVPKQGERFNEAEIEVPAIARQKVISTLRTIEKDEKLSFYFPN